MTTSLLQTPLHDWHAQHQGRMVDFAGWSMPVQYTSIVEEHTATRTKCGVFDISHMGRLRFDGPEAEAFLDQLVTRKVAGMSVGRIRYGLVTNDDGGILDDVLVYHLADSDGSPFFMMVVNASNCGKICDWIQPRLEGRDVQFTNLTTETAMIAVQGPEAIAAANALVADDISQLSYYTGIVSKIGDVTATVSRTGYTGEDGVELIVPNADALDLWLKLIDGGATAVGLGARDTLRLEAAMPLYGHELSEEIDPYKAGLGFAVNLKDREFPGRDALAQKKADGSDAVRVGIEVDGRRAPREHYSILHEGNVVGEVTSGTYSPTLQKSIGMAYVPPELSAVGTELAVDLRGKPAPAKVVALPFYSRPS